MKMNKALPDRMAERGLNRPGMTEDSALSPVAIPSADGEAQT